MKVKLNAIDSIRRLAHDVAHAAKADVLFYSGGIDEPFDYMLIGKIRKHKKHTNVVLVLTTNGGSADSAYRMMRAIRSAYPDGKITIFVPAFCKSAGTLMAIGSDELVMSDGSELGPLDVQLRKPDEVGEYSSGLTPLQALSALRSEAFNCFEQHFLMLREKSGRQITAKTAAEIAVKLTIGWFQPIYEQLDPMRLSETQRAMMIAWEYGIRLACGNIDEDGLNRLISAYPSHGFIIDRHEASEIFNKVRKPTDGETALSSGLIGSGLMDAGMYGTQPVIFILSSENCVISPDNSWEGIEYEDGNKEEPENAAGKPSHGRGKVAGKGNQKSVRSEADRNVPTKDSRDNGVPEPLAGA
jgi:hypothetical protein